MHAGLGIPNMIGAQPTSDTSNDLWKSYTVGFCIDATKTRVMLINKAKPEWQKGLLNGVGGRIEPGETPLTCMVREFTEETGVAVYDWQQFCTGYITTHQGACICHYFVAVTLAPYTMINPRRDAVEQAEWIELERLGEYKFVPNILWLIAMAGIKLHKPDWQELATFVTH